MTFRLLLLAAAVAVAGCRATTLGTEETGTSVKKALAKQTRKRGKAVQLDAEDATRTMTQQHVPLDKDQGRQQVNLIKQ
jgi:hypothetical protein